MTIIETDNPIIRFYVWMYDLMWQYWHIALALCILAMWIISRHFIRKQREWDAYMDREQQKFEDFKRKTEKYDTHSEKMP